MADFINSKILNDSTVSPNKNFKNTIYLKKCCYTKIDSLKNLTDSSSRNDVIEKAVDFYFGFITSQLSQEFLCGVLGDKIEGLIGTLGTRIAHGNFRNAVEMDILTRMVASIINLSAPEYDRLRKKSVGDVKRLNGTIDILDAINEQDKSEDDK